MLRKMRKKNYGYWNSAATYCYEIKCNCKKCKLIKNLETINKRNCQMKKAVKILFEKLGAPKNI